MHTAAEHGLWVSTHYQSQTNEDDFKFKTNHVLTAEKFDPIRVHKQVRETGKHNFEEAKIQLPSKINFDPLDKLSSDYWDYQLNSFLKFGFPLDFPRDKESQLLTTDTSHASARDHPQHIDTYLRVEMEHNAIKGPYKDPPYGDNTHVSPFMSREKVDSDNRRIIIDLSWPQYASINHFTIANKYLSTAYKLQYPTIDNTTTKLKEIGPEALIYKTDLSILSLRSATDREAWPVLDFLTFSDISCTKTAPSTVCNCLGVVVDTKEATLSVPTGKLAEIIKKCKKVNQQTQITRQELQSLLGSLMFIHKCVRPTRYFVNRLLEALRCSEKKHIKVTADMCKDIAWFREFLPVFNGTASYDMIEFAETLEIDACLTHVGGVWNNAVYSAPLPDHIKDNPNLYITHYEMINILVALRIWGSAWAHKRILLRSDNMAVVRSGYTRDAHLASYIRNIWLLTATYVIQLNVVHIAGKDNKVADLLSRWSDSQKNQQQLLKLVEHPIWYKVNHKHFYVNIDI